MNVSLKLLSTEHLPALIRLERDEFGPDSKSWSWFGRCFEGRHVGIVAVCKGRLLGYIIAGTRGRRVRIYRVNVDPEFRRRNVASRMLHTLANRTTCILCGEWVATVPADRLGVQHWLSARDFVCEGERDGQLYFRWTR